MLMQALGRISWIAALVLLAACGNSTGPAVSRNSPGTGSSTLKVTADIDANDDPTVIGGFSTDYSVSLRDGLSNPVSAATVTISNPSLGTITLPETATGSGDYLLTGNTFPGGDFTLNVTRGADNVRNVVLGGPAVHKITAPVKNATVPANQPLTVRWTVPSQAKSAEVETKNFGPVTLPDTGAYVIAAVNNPLNASQRIRVFRFNEVDVAGGLPGSRLRVMVRSTVEPVIVQ
ncbi:MAG TPA: hypothetical protein VK113_00390 [Gemmatimonadales bacterium]|nr:hypothetical protein [Gemmatimonadales bacterium]